MILRMREKRKAHEDAKSEKNESLSRVRRMPLRKTFAESVQRKSPVNRISTRRMAEAVARRNSLKRSKMAESLIGKSTRTDRLKNESISKVAERIARKKRMAESIARKTSRVVPTRTSRTIKANESFSNRLAKRVASRVRTNESLATRRTSRLSKPVSRRVGLSESIRSNRRVATRNSMRTSNRFSR